MKHTYILLSVIFFLSVSLNAQDENVKNKGEFNGDLFLNSNYNFDREQASFRLNRLHFGYKYQISEKIYFNGMIESAREDYEPSGDYNGITNLFEFCLGFNLPKLEGKFGLIGTQLNQKQEQLWQHRYIDKVFADKYGFAPTNDFGAIVIFKPSDKLNFDVAITNGEGHKNPQADSVFRYALGATLNLNSKFTARIYSDLLYHPDRQQTNFIGILGYTSDIFTFGAEWNLQMIESKTLDEQRNGVSIYATYNINEKYQFFGRYDYIESDKPEEILTDWDINNEGQLMILGIQYKLNEKVNLAFDYRSWKSEVNDKNNSFLFFDVALSF